MSLRRSPGLGRSRQFSVSALRWNDAAAARPASSGTGARMKMFLHRALRRALREAGECVIYAQEPLAARAALQARRGPHQRVVLAVHFRTSQADEWANMGMIRPGGTVFRSIRQVEREVIPQVDGLMYVSEWARQAVLGWLPEAAAVPATVIDNFVASPAAADPGQQPLGDLVTMGGLEPVKNHRYLLEILAEAGRAGRRLTLDVYGDGLLRQDLTGRPFRWSWRAGPLPWLPASCARISAALPRLRSTSVFRIVFTGDH